MTNSRIQLHIRALHEQGGFTMIVTLGVMLVTSLLLVAAFTASSGEIQLTSRDRAEKKAYYAAEAGIEDYEYHLTQDGNYLSYCTTPPTANPALNQVGETKNRATVPSINGEASEEAYAIQLLPAESDTNKEDHKCDPNHLVETMLEEQGAATGTFRIESTGYSGGEERTIVATFRNANFVSFVWYTKYETFDPIIYGLPLRTQCEAFYPERPKEPECANNYFIGGESVNGPMHTEDHVAVCESPVFGRNSRDRIEFGADGEKKGEGYSNEGYGCSSSPKFLGTHVPPSEVPSIEPPPGDEELQHIVESGYEFHNKTEIFLQGTTMSISTWEGGVKKTTPGVPYPPNGVIYVTGGCHESTSPFGPKPGYNEDESCGNVYVHGEYSQALTIASQNDVIINGNTYPSTVAGKLGSEPSGNAMLGLIANNFVRIYHPVVRYYEGTGSKKETCTKGKGDKFSTTQKECEYNIPTKLSNECDAPNAPEDMTEPYVYAAILAVKHAVLVDNFDCGTPTLGHLNLFGTAAALFSNGLTGVFNGSGIINGYPYNLIYDNRLEVEEPPHFLNPIQAAWYIQRQTLSPNP